MSRRVSTTPEGDAQIRTIDGWWRENRRASPGTRRLLLKGTRYHVYYVSVDGEVRVLAIWHAKRGAGPPLRST